MDFKTDAEMVERRSGKERRIRRFGDIRWLMRTGQRRRIRRQVDRRRIFVLDYYSPKMFLVLILILILSVVDAVLTLWLIDRGAMEINPVMAYYLKLGPYIFMATKYLLTVAVVTICVLMNYTIIRYFKFRFIQLLNLFAGCFAMVVAWELYLIAHLINT